jgi:ribosomal protein L35AE/L33A
LSQRHAGNVEAANAFLDDAIKNYNLSQWPGPIISFLRSEKGSADEVLKQATDNDKLTEAHAYLGLVLALNEKRADALTHLRWVKEHGNKGFVEYGMAIAEIDRLEVKK